MTIKPFLNENFLLDNSIAERLFHEYARELPIIDYHNHLSPHHIATDKTFSSITEAWLDGDHYKWRAMRANGIDENFITGNKSDKDKFQKWAETIPYAMRNPLYHWTHMELQRYFNIKRLLNPFTAEKIYNECNEQLQNGSNTSLGLLKKMKVEVICTTDDPTDSLQHHKEFNNETINKDLRMFPTFRPDKFLKIDRPSFLDSIHELRSQCNKNIETFEEFLEALNDRILHFQSLGCRISDHGLSRLYRVEFSDKDLNRIFKKAITGSNISEIDAAIFQTGLLFHLAKSYHAHGWIMQLHLGPIRNNNSRLAKKIGFDAGCDSIGDWPQAEGLSSFLDKLDQDESLPKTILYNINPGDNEVFATMAGNFNDGSMPGKVQWGSAWWFLDQKDGMEKQLNILSNMGLLNRFIGMLTDSRSFLSFPRHEYFRRILCNLIGKDIHNGTLPNDMEWLGGMVKNICYFNAKEYFGF